LLGDLAQGGPVFCMQVPQPVQSPLGEFAPLGRVGSLSGDPGHLGHGLFLHPAELLCMSRGLGGHGVAEGTLALAAPHHFRGHELHVGHGGFGGVGGTAQLHLLELGVVLAFFHGIVGLLYTW
jgi:hypothetical protein